MIHRPIKDLSEIQIGSRIYYNDPITIDKIYGTVVNIDFIGPQKAFIYVASPYQDENIHVEYGLAYKDIIVFDDIPNELPCGTYRDPVKGQYGKITGDEH